MGGDAAHRPGRVAVAVGAGFVSIPGPSVPKRLPFQDGEHAGVGGVVALHRLGLRSHEVEAGTAVVGIRRT